MSGSQILSISMLTTKYFQHQATFINKSTQRAQTSTNAKISTKSDLGFESGFSD